MVNEKYNGWANYETWCVNLWLTNDEKSYNQVHSMARECWLQSSDKNPNEFTDREGNARIMLGEALEHLVSEEQAQDWMSDQASLFADILNHALGRVEWFEIANSLLEDIDKEEE